jgi:glycosyltransferase involved in cell wall biosynthesis
VNRDNERIPKEPPQIPAIINNTGVPLWSVMIPAYNCYKYLAETIESVLQQAQAEEKMQIEVVDDCSTDGEVEELVKTLGKERIFYFRQKKNVGSLRNFETCINRAKGTLIHILHGDDKVNKGFYDEMEELFRKNPSIGAGFCRVNYINEDGNFLFTSKAEMKEAGVLKNALILLGERQRIETPAMVVKRTVYEKLGAFHSVIYGEDWEMWTRIAANYEIGYTPAPLATYRRHSSSITSDKIVTAENIKDLEKVMDLTDKYFETKDRIRARKKAKYFYANYAVRTANSLWHDQKHVKGAKAQLKAALNLSKHPAVLFAAIKVIIKILTRYDNRRFFSSNLLL